jgi:Lon-like protease
VSRRAPYRHPAVVWVLSVVIVVMVLVAGWQIIEQGANGYYAFAPGTAPRITANPQCRASHNGELVLPDGSPCALIVVPADRAHPIQGSLYMVDVLVGPATPGQYILSKLGLLHSVESGTQLIPAGAVLGTTPAAQLPCQDAQQMNSATSSAEVVALRQLGYQVKEKDLGAQLVEVVPGSPAASAGLRCNDLVTAVNAAAVHTAADFVAAIHAAKPGQTVHVTVKRPATSGGPRTLTLAATLSGTPPLAGQPAAPDQPFLGVASTTQTVFVYPFNVDVNVGAIGGPSAGLALTLGLLDVLSAGNLTGGHRVAATGTINLDGTVGDVGGVAQKAVAVREAGAQVFFVPTVELKAAQSQAGSMKVLPVANLDQALNDLKALGGHIPPAASAT